mgnify:CR=1 FL=1
MIVTLKDFPEIERVIRAANPKYRKHKAIVVAGPRVTLHGTYWSGGSRTSYFGVNLSTFQCGGAPHYNPPQFGGPQSDPVVNLEPGAAIVALGTFCGKTATATVYVHPSNVAKLLPGTPTMQQVMEA